MALGARIGKRLKGYATSCYKPAKKMAKKPPNDPLQVKINI
jgi:hypothetical protein